MNRFYNPPFTVDEIIKKKFEDIPKTLFVRIWASFWFDTSFVTMELNYLGIGQTDVRSKWVKKTKACNT